ncbi:MAG TPA: ABC transporter substrate-binding protein/permease, partial [Thermoanaerobaculia bacterium]|nr:ABC transporter substrate-binding protein/permease [Thermoanaerobaculia bacterium]
MSPLRERIIPERIDFFFSLLASRPIIRAETDWEVRHAVIVGKKRFGVSAAAFLALSLAGPSAAGQSAPAAVPELRWGGDSEGGAPFVEADPQDPSVLRGFDVEVAEAIARGLARRPRFVQVAFTSIDASVARGDFDIGMSGVEDTPSRRAALSATVPYFEFREVLTVRQGDAARFTSLPSLRKKRVGTLSGTIAYDTLKARETALGFETVAYDDDVHPYTDLLDGRLDAVLLDHVIAARATARTSGLATIPEAVTRGRYVGVLAKGNAALRDAVDAVLVARAKDGTLEKIYRKWNLWDDDEARFVADLAAGKLAHGGESAATVVPAPRPPLLSTTLRYLPSFLSASLITIVLSCAAMALAVALGALIATGRVYGGAVTRALLTGYVELMRGTPVLLQLFVLYYGLAAVVKLPAFVAALLGLGLNYAAYESEIYRGALEAVPRIQLEAARTLGFTERQVLTLVRGPQAFRIALAPMTNDFVALLKDSSLVSVITVVELTKETSIFASNIGSWVVPGMLCAAMYLAMSLPL